MRVIIRDQIRDRNVHFMPHAGNDRDRDRLGDEGGQEPSSLRYLAGREGVEATTWPEVECA